MTYKKQEIKINKKQADKQEKLKDRFNPQYINNYIKYMYSSNINFKCYIQ